MALLGRKGIKRVMTEKYVTWHEVSYEGYRRVVDALETNGFTHESQASEGSLQWDLYTDDIGNKVVASQKVTPPGWTKNSITSSLGSRPVIDDELA